MLNTPSEKDLGLALSVRLCHFLNDRMVESHSTSERSPCLEEEYGSASLRSTRSGLQATHLEQDPVVLANLYDIGVSHEWVQVNLVDGGQGRAGIQKFLDVFRTPVRHLSGRYISSDRSPNVSLKGEPDA